jgi:hypothetical protein
MRFYKYIGFTIKRKQERLVNYLRKLVDKGWNTNPPPFPLLHAHLLVHRVYVAIVTVEEVSVEGARGILQGRIRIRCWA